MEKLGEPMITLETIRKLRREGNTYEANKLLEEYHKGIKEQRIKDKKQLEKDYIQNLKDKGICTSCKKRRAFHGSKCNQCAFCQHQSKVKPKPNYRYELAEKDRFDVFKDGKFAHRVSLNPLHCDCKGFTSHKMCKHIRFILSQLEDKGGIFK